MGNIILYILIIMLTAYLNLMYEIPFGPALLSCELTLPVLCFLQVLYLRRKTSVSIRAASALVKTGEYIYVKFRIANRSRIPLLCARFQILCRHGNNMETHGQLCRIQANAKGTALYTFRILAATCGTVHLQAKKFMVYDYFRLFGLRVRESPNCDVTVLPVVHEMHVEIQDETRMFPSDSCDYSPNRSGDDPSEVFQVREYRPGDRPQSIHWKLSARTDGLYVKEYSFPIRASVMLVLEGGKPLADEKEAQAFIETAVSLSHALLGEGCAHHAAWIPQGKDIVQIWIHDEESLEAFVSSSLELMETSFMSGVVEALHGISPGQTWLRTLTVTSELAVLCDGSPVMKIMPEDVGKCLSGQIIMV